MILLAACTTQKIDRTNYGKIFVYLPVENEIVVDGVVYEIESYDVYINGTKNLKKEAVGSQTERVAFAVPKGDYEVEVIAKDSSGNTIDNYEEALNVAKRETKRVDAIMESKPNVYVYLPFPAENKENQQTRTINANTNGFKIIIRERPETGNIYTTGTIKYNQTYTSNPVSFVLPATDYTIQVYSQKTDYNPALGAGASVVATATYGYDGKAFTVTPGSSQTLRLFLNEFESENNTVSAIASGTALSPSIHITFPATYAANVGLSGTFSSGVSLYYASDTTVNGPVAASVQLNTDNATGTAFVPAGQPVLKGDSIVYRYWFTCTDKNSVPFVFPTSEATVLVSDGEEVSIIIE
jgi:hypothetical protein